MCVIETRDVAHPLNPNLPREAWLKRLTKPSAFLRSLMPILPTKFQGFR
jgi:hypothetical protein